MPLAAAFTKENARENALKSVAVRRERAEQRDRILSSLPASADERARHEMVLRQIDKIDWMINRVADPNLLHKLVSSKDILYHMIFPKRGSLRPKAGRTIDQPTIDAQDWQPISKPSVTPNP